MFAVVYASPAVIPACCDPAGGMDFARMVNGGQELTWGPLVVAGEEITTEVEVADISERGCVSCIPSCGSSCGARSRSTPASGFATRSRTHDSSLSS